MDSAAASSEALTEIGLEIVLSIFKVYAKYGLRNHRYFGCGVILDRTKGYLILEMNQGLPAYLAMPTGVLILDMPDDLDKTQIEAIQEEFKTFIDWTKIIPEYSSLTSDNRRGDVKLLVTSFQNRTLPGITDEVLRISDQPNLLYSFYDPDTDFTSKTYWQVVRKMAEEGKFGSELKVIDPLKTPTWYRPDLNYRYDFFQNVFYQYWQLN